MDLIQQIFYYIFRLYIIFMYKIITDIYIPSYLRPYDTISCLFGSKS